MTMLVTRQQAADHLRIDNVDAEADALDLLVQAASAVVLDYIEMELAEFGDSDSDGEVEVPEHVKAATLLLVGDMHRHRDGSSPSYTEATLPPSVRALLYPLKTWGFDSDAIG